jgi:hypothetical protein
MAAFQTPRPFSKSLVLLFLALLSVVNYMLEIPRNFQDELGGRRGCVKNLNKATLCTVTQYVAKFARSRFFFEPADLGCETVGMFRSFGYSPKK